jgi:hypothetical protein
VFSGRRVGPCGGYGNPLERDPEAVRQDVVDGIVSPEAAERDYGVVISAPGPRWAGDRCAAGQPHPGMIASLGRESRDLWIS